MLLIIGNGFDINLGLKTRYSDFMRWWISNDIVHIGSLLEYLRNKFNKSSNHDELRWIDLENELKVYCKSFMA